MVIALPTVAHFEQTLGRILRFQDEGKYVLDLVDDQQIFKNQFHGRLQAYVKYGFA